MESSQNSISYRLAGRPGQQAAIEGPRGRASSIRARPPHGSGAESHGAGCGPTGVQTFGVEYGLRECSVILHRLGVEHAKGCATLVKEGEHEKHLGGVGSVRESPSAGQPDAASRVDSVQISPLAGEGSGEAPGVVVLLPLQDFSCTLCGMSAGAITWVHHHYTSRHGNALVRYSCRSCGKTSHLWKSIMGHVPKCKGPRVPAPAGAVQCEGCPLTFSTRRACSIHEMHVHPAIRNRKRILEGRKRGSSALSQTEEEIGAQATLDADGEGASGGRVPPKRPRRGIAGTCGGPLEPPASSSVPPDQPNLPEGGLLDLLQREARKMVGEVEGDGTELSRILAAWLEGCDQLPALVEAATQRILQGLDSGRRRGPAPMSVRALRRLGSRQRRRLKLLAKRRAYSHCQHLFKRNPARLAKEVLDGNGEGRCPIPIGTVYNTYMAKWETPSPFGGLGRFQVCDRANNGHLAGPISTGEIQHSLQLASSASAPGPDGIEKQDILRWDPKCETLTQLFNMWWFTGVIPTRLKKSRTVLIPKTSDPGAVMDIGNWRPITIGSMVLRLFTRVVARRLTEACPLHPRQRGFRPSPGCAENLEVLQGLIRHSKEERSQLAVVFVDFAQAFDTVSHEHILSALGKIKVDPHVVGLIQAAYTNSCTSVEVGGRLTPDIQVRVGVKQGDPMSPLLFNLALDPLIHGLERFGKGYTVAGHSVTSLAFADDLVLIGGSWGDMAHNLGLLAEFCQNTGLRVQSKKCHGFLVRPCSGSFSVNDCPPWVLGGKALRLTSIDEAVKYLGVKVNPWGGIVRPDLAVSLDKWCQSIGKAPLKPSQRVALLNQHAIPRLFYQADHCGVSDGVLRNLDGTIRRTVKRWLRLSPSTCDGLLYARNRDGGLGICKLARHIPLVQARRIFCLAHSSDELVRAVMRSSSVESKFKRVWLRAGGTKENLPSLGGVASNERGDAAGLLPRPFPVPSDWRREEFLRWAGLPIQGVGIAGFHGSKVSNAWVRNPVGFKERHYIAALQLRAGVYPTLEFRYRGRGKTVAGCRRCSQGLESCSHILGQCPAVQGARIARHNKLCRLLAAEAEGLGWEVHREWPFSTPQGDSRRLDLVLVRDSLALVVDITVRYEFAPDTLACAGRQKVEYYGPYKNVIARKLGVSEVQVYGFPLGARGLWFAENDKVLKVMGLSEARARSFSRLLSRRTILYSVDILRGFASSLG
ncbi:hypothetical protein M9458_055308 [Cirrhinus mrigala]|uniref:Reverse transcriptase domain-containing protein n=1 Tax=Cirrhinus mrigala TaxID=683832 RepID=A0ABD0MH71_CIRMR